MTRKEWFLRHLSPEIAAKAIANTFAELPSRLEDNVSSDRKVLLLAFIWGHSPEEHNYWMDINNTYPTDKSKQEN